MNPIPRPTVPTYRVFSSRSTGLDNLLYIAAISVVLASLVTGCLETSSPSKQPVPVSSSLSSIIHYAQQVRLQTLSDTAKTISQQTSLSPSETQTIWEKSFDASQEVADKVIGPAIMQRMTATKTPAEISQVWIEISIGYHP